MLLGYGRCELGSGASEPTAAELEGYKGPVSEPGSSKGRGLPCFWLHVLRSQVSRNGLQLGTEVEGGGGEEDSFLAAAGPSYLTTAPAPFYRQDLLASVITSRDAKALAYLDDVRFVRGLRGLLVEFVFRENPFFENRVSPPCL